MNTRIVTASLFVCAIFFGFSVRLGCEQVDFDIDILRSELTYIDNVTDPNKKVKRELRAIGDNNYWAKPDVVDLAITLKNSGPDISNFSVIVEMYMVVKKLDRTGLKMVEKASDQSGNYSIFDFEKPVWLWNRGFGNKRVKALKRDEEIKIEFKNLKIDNKFYPTSLEIVGKGIKIFAEVRRPNLTTLECLETVYIPYSD